jgi:hypothetical protein
VKTEPAIISALATIIAGLLTSSGLALGGVDTAAISTGAATILASLLVALVTRFNVFSKDSVEKLTGTAATEAPVVLPAAPSAYDDWPAADAR